MEMMFKEELDRDKLMKRLDGFLTRNIDRELFELPVLEERKASETIGKSKPAKSRRAWCSNTQKMRGFFRDDENLVRFSPKSHGSKTPKTLLLLARHESCFPDPVYGVALLSPREDIGLQPGLITSRSAPHFEEYLPLISYVPVGNVGFIALLF